MHPPWCNVEGVHLSMGGKPNPGTKKDGRIKGRGDKPGPKPKGGKK